MEFYWQKVFIILEFLSQLFCLTFEFFREFTMAEIEHFCDPSDKRYPKFNNVRNTEMLLYSACNQMDGQSAELKTVGEAVDSVSIALLS